MRHTHQPPRAHQTQLQELVKICGHYWLHAIVQSGYLSTGHRCHGHSPYNFIHLYNNSSAKSSECRTRLHGVFE